jgi:hypothetical protein
MARYLVERTFPTGLSIPVTAQGAELVRGVIDNNAGLGVTWIHSYVSGDKTKTFCVYDAPTQEAIRAAAGRNALPVGAITQVSVLDPYFFL